LNLMSLDPLSAFASPPTSSPGSCSGSGSAPEDIEWPDFSSPSWANYDYTSTSGVGETIDWPQLATSADNTMGGWLDGVTYGGTGGTQFDSLQFPQWDPNGFAIYLNSAPANIIGGSFLSWLGFNHQWISTTDGQAAGMGNMQGVPGANGQTSPDLPFTATQVVSHVNVGRVPTSVQTYTNVDQAAIDTYLVVGTPTGPWVPLFNDCNTWAQTAITNSTPHGLTGMGGAALPPAGYQNLPPLMFHFTGQILRLKAELLQRVFVW
jgi:hypothetical protein